MESLTAKHCVPCEGGMPALTGEEIGAMMPQVPGWKLTDGKLVLDIRDKNFKQALELVNRIGQVAESEGHHPDIQIYGWNNVRLELSTHAIGGLSENDFILAAKITGVVNQFLPA